MKRTFIFTTLLLLFSTNLCFGVNVFSKKDNVASKEAEGFLQLSSINVELLPYGIKHPGIGVGYDFEKYLANHMALSADAGAGAFYAHWFNFSDFTTTLSAGANFRCYPMYEALRGPYGGFGSGCDAIFYLGKNDVPADAQKLFFYVKPEIGWKFYILNHFMIDVNMDYRKRFIVTPNNLPKFYYDALAEGFHLGIAFKFFWAK